MSVEVHEFGTLSDGRSTKLYTLSNGDGVTASFTDLGAAWVSMVVPDRNGTPGDVLLGYDSPETYLRNPTSTGECVGRSANRTADASFTLDGVTYHLGKNSLGKNNLHSGPDKWCSVLFDSAGEQSKLGSRVTFTKRFADGSQGFPGNLDFSVSYTLTEDSEVMIEYRAVSDRKTVINPTNHAYFNLGGQGSGDILGHIVWINADYYTPTTEDQIPTGEIAPVAGTPFDFTIAKPVGQEIGARDPQLAAGKGYDHNFVLNRFDGKINLAARASDPDSGRILKVYTDLPGVQFYTGNSLSETQAACKGGTKYGPRTGLCFETQFYPDAVHHPDWPQPVFDAGQEYHHFTIYKFAVRLDEKKSEGEQA